MLDHNQISGIEVQDMLLEKGFNLHLSLRPLNDDRIINWATLYRFFEKYNVFLKPEQVAGIINLNEIEYNQLLAQLSVVIPSINKITKKEDRFLRKNQLDNNQHAFIHNVKRVLKYGTKLKLPLLRVDENSKWYNVCSEIDASSSLSDTMKKYASQSSIFLDPVETVVVETKESKHSNIRSSFSVEQIQSLHELMVKDFKILLDEKIRTFLSESCVEESNLNVLNEKTEYEAILAKKFKESESVLLTWKEMEMDQNHKIKKIVKANEIFEEPLDISKSVDLELVNKEISKFYKIDLETSLKCLIYGCIEIAGFKSNKNCGFIADIQVENAVESIVMQTSIFENKSSINSFLAYISSPSYKILDLYKSLISNFNSIKAVQEKYRKMCKVCIFADFASDAYNAHSSDKTSNSITFYDFESEYAMQTDIIVFYNSPLSDQEAIQKRVFELFYMYIDENLMLPIESTLQYLTFYIYLPISDNIDDKIRYKSIELNAKHQIIHDYNVDIKLCDFKDSTMELDLPLIDEFHLSNFKH
eukprot:NODE_174_length_15906_cov_0.510533.p1 type:complete len:531 gc:universal NODE_174_length_15906_cov_0.510533:9353-7761(-)